jgi:drug/metabolite transporter (DMT)-like permease
MRAPGAPRAIDSPQALGGTTTSTHTAWIVAAFVMTALWALVVVVNKKALESVTPLAVNFFIRLVAIGGLLAITVPLTVFHLWSNGFGINAAAAGWIALAAVGTWLVAFNAYYFALRGERVAVVAPITSTDPIWTAFFAWVIVGTAFGAPTLVGMVVTMAGVVLISRWMDQGEDAPGAELTGAAALAGAAHGEVLPDERPAAAVAATRSAGAAKARLIGLAVLTAAGWGLGPVLIQLATDAYGRATATMMLLSQVCGALMLGAILLLRRQTLTTGPLTPAARRGAVWLIVLAGLLEASVSVLFYLTIVALGPLLAMLIMATTPVFSIVFGVVFLRERPGWRLTLAAVVTVAGVLIATLDGLH